MAATHNLIFCIGAHMRGLPLNKQLLDLHAEFVREASTEPLYRMYALDGPVKKPGIVRVHKDGEMGQPEARL